MENTVKTAAVTTRDPPRRMVQDAIAHVNEKIAAAVDSSTNLRQTFKQKISPCTWYCCDGSEARAVSQ